MKLLFVVLMGCSPAFALIPTRYGCAPTAEAAVARFVGGSTDLVARGGYRVVSLRTDKVRAKRYALVASCDDASQPLRSIELQGGVQEVQVASVRLGDRVTVLAGGADSRVELTGHAQQGGALSDMIRIEMPKFSEDGVAAVIRCRVVGKDIVEVVR